MLVKVFMSFCKRIEFYTNSNELKFKFIEMNILKIFFDISSTLIDY